MSQITGLLESSHVDLRIAAGDAIALIYELMREHDEVRKISQMFLIHTSQYYNLPVANYITAVIGINSLVGATPTSLNPSDSYNF